jgi:hypothetical protein
MGESQIGVLLYYMLIRIGHDIVLRLYSPTAVFYLLRVHPSRKGDLLKPENFRTEPKLPIEEYLDGFGNLCGRVNAPTGVHRFLNEAIIRDPGTIDAYAPDALQHDIRELPPEPLSFVLPSRCSFTVFSMAPFCAWFWQNP